MDKTQAPERIWVQPIWIAAFESKDEEGDVEYIRKDLVAPPAAQVTVAWELLRRASTLLEHHGIAGGLLADINEAIAGEGRTDG